MKLFCFVCENDYNDNKYHPSCDCGEAWCSDECAEKDGFKDDSGFQYICNNCKENNK
jgi:hypothetical protein